VKTARFTGLVNRSRSARWLIRIAQNGRERESATGTPAGTSSVPGHARAWSRGRRFTPVNVCHELADTRLERLGESHDGEQAHIALAPFDAADVGEMQVGLESQVQLRPATGLSKAAHGPAEGYQARIFAFHAPKLGQLRR